MPFKSDKQRRFFQAVAGGMKPDCGCTDKPNCNCGPTKAVAKKMVNHDLGRQRKMSDMLKGMSY